MPGDLHASLADSSTTPYWLDSPDRPAPRPGLDADAVADLCIVGGGYSGLWTALLAKERDPARDVVLLEGSRIGWAASGRNGGFCAASLTHGHANGADRWPDEIDALDGSAARTSTASRRPSRATASTATSSARARITVATEPHQVEWLRELTAAERPARRSSTRTRCGPRWSRRPTSAASSSRDDTALVDPAAARLGSRRGRRGARRTHP